MAEHGHSSGAVYLAIDKLPVDETMVDFFVCVFLEESLTMYTS